jgi:hypothetical protein
MKQNIGYLLLTAFATAASQLVAVGQPRKPQFNDYIVADKYRGTPARVNLSAPPAARYYRTRLREGAAKGPNFAGHYTIITWGCGSDCYDIAVVDARTGRVWFAPFTGAIDLEFRRNSRLLIVDPEAERQKRFPGGLPPGFGDAPEIFFVWRANRFVQVYPTDGTKPLPAVR